MANTAVAPQLVADVVQTALAATTVRVAGAGLRPATAGAPAATMAISLPVSYAGEEIAQLEAAPRPAESSLTKTDLAILDDVDTAIAQTRALAHGLLPPVLANRGLVAAVRDRARPDNGLHVEVLAPDGPPLLRQPSRWPPCASCRSR